MLIYNVYHCNANIHLNCIYLLNLIPFYYYNFFFYLVSKLNVVIFILVLAYRKCYIDGSLEISIVCNDLKKYLCEKQPIAAVDLALDLLLLNIKS